MATITLPSFFSSRVAACKLELSTNQRVGAAPFGGSEQAIDLLNDRWLMSLETGVMEGSRGPAIEALIGSFRGQVNTCALHHIRRPVPIGTVRGTLLLNAAVAQGASSIVVKDCVPTTGTLLAGDMLSVGGLLLMVSTDCTAVAGVITVPITNRLRVAQLINAAVTWNRPTASFRLLATSGVNYTSTSTPPVSFDFGEAI